MHPVQGTSYELNGDINNLSSTSNIDMLVRALVNCNDSVLDVKEGKACVIGLPTEGALRVLAAKILK
jgi:magnesium-transporting ATPase (P-type)